MQQKTATSALRIVGQLHLIKDLLKKNINKLFEKKIVESKMCMFLELSNNKQIIFF